MPASLKDEKNRIIIPGFYDDVVELTEEEKTKMSPIPFDLDGYKEELDVAELDGEKGYSTVERVSVRPALDVNGIWGGYTGEGAKTVLPSKAHAKISMRLVPNQNSDKISQLFKAHFESIVPKTMRVKVTAHHGGEPAVVKTDSVAFEAASRAFQEAWDKKPIPTRDGGSIPIVSLFQRELALESILLGFGLDTDAIHSPNESYGVFNYFKGIETIILFYKHYAELSKEKS
jgi:acetylornithine deacetylase/succinyl-diaminopimelate desuccinylase-like protein